LNTKKINLIFLFFFLFFYNAFCLKKDFFDSKANNKLISKQKPKIKFNNKENINPTKKINFIYLAIKILIILIILIFLLILIKKFFGNKKIVTNLEQPFFNTLAIIPLTPKKQIHFIDVSGILYLIGITENNISLIDKIENKDKIDEIKLMIDMSDSNLNKKSFLDQIIGVISKKQKVDITKIKTIEDYK